MFQNVHQFETPRFFSVRNLKSVTYFFFSLCGFLYFSIFLNNFSIFQNHPHLYVIFGITVKLSINGHFQEIDLESFGFGETFNVNPLSFLGHFFHFLMIIRLTLWVFLYLITFSNMSGHWPLCKGTITSIFCFKMLIIFIFLDFLFFCAKETYFFYFHKGFYGSLCNFFRVITLFSKITLTFMLLWKSS